MNRPADELLAEPIRHSLWRMGWESLRPLQQQTIHTILGTKRDVILAAKTAAGKTEAAFLPILSEICENCLGSVRALYVGPLKALINDQFRRLEELCQYAEIPVHRWHGDVSGDKKRQLVERPGGVLLITPESLEALFVTRSAVLGRLFHSLSFVVIDELHSLMGSERGTQLRSQLFRLERYAVQPFRLVALSATIGDPNAAACWMRPDGTEQVEIIRDDSDKKSVLYRIHAYLKVPAVRPPEQKEENVELVPPDDLFQDLYQTFRGTKNLIFANSKATVEDLTDRLNQLGRTHQTGEEFLIHHGSLARDVREETERLMQGDRPFTTVCSSTLELGIDIGNVQTIGQIGPTWSVSSLVQRLGRSGRREGESQRMRVVILAEEPNAKSTLDERLHSDLLQAVAMTELMLQEWVESRETEPHDLSTLVQQTLSLIAETGGTTAQELFECLIRRGAFRFLNQRQFIAFLRDLAKHDLIEQRPEGPLILGLIGERLVRHYDFYAAFVSPPEYRVLNRSQFIGMLSAHALPQPSDHILLSGRRWQVKEIDDQKQQIAVTPATGRKVPYFPPSQGEIDPQIRQKMREILLDDVIPAYLDGAGVQLLKAARAEAKRAGLQQSDLVSVGLHQSLWFPWTGSRTMRTLHLMFEWADVPATSQKSGLTFSLAGSNTDCLSSIRHVLSNRPTAVDLVTNASVCQRRKWDQFVATDLLVTSFEHDALNIEDACERLNDLAVALG